MTTFKDIRYLIYSPLELVIGSIHLENLDTHDESLDKYNNYEVIGIRSATHYRSDYYYESNVVVSLRESTSKHYENYLENCNYNDKFVCEQCKGE